MCSLNMKYAQCASDYDQLIGKLRKSHDQKFIHFVFRQRDKSMFPYDLIIAKHENAQVGLVRRSLKYNQEKKTHYIFIDFVYILPEYRGVGYSAPLFNNGLSYGKGMHDVRLHILNGENNVPAYRLYKKFGFEWYNRQRCVMYRKCDY